MKIPLPDRRAFCSLLATAAGAASAQNSDAMDTFHLEPLGIIETPFPDPAGTPIQPSRANGARGIVRVAERFRAGLKDLQGFERIWLVYWFHKAAEARMLVTPFLDQTQRGIFATRAPARPSPIGMSAVRLLSVNAGTLEVADVDIVNGTPLLDIKPYVPEFDCYPGSRAGWFDDSESRRSVADDRFEPGSQEPKP